ncbi:hypothetical protein M434DRAFT_26370 [Hypoxylon sp. CO27-5]|nr:hypothetical protein M434DRAFT_26370 [Hypoxylon sp. CO27-5]
MGVDKAVGIRNVANSQGIKGKLCRTCKSSFHGTRPTDDYGIAQHHQTYQGFVAGRDAGYFICAWLWAKHVVPQDTKGRRVYGAEEYSVLGEFRISCDISGYEDEYYAYFHIDYILAYYAPMVFHD